MKILRALDKNFEKWICGFLVAMIVLIMLMQIVMRYFFNTSLPWTEEFCRYCYIYFMFIGTALAAKENSSLRVDALVELLPKTVQKVLNILVDLVVTALLVYLFFGSVTMTRDLYGTGSYSPGLQLPMYLVYLSAPIGILLTILRYIQNLYYAITGKQKGGEETC